MVEQIKGISAGVGTVEAEKLVKLAKNLEDAIREKNIEQTLCQWAIARKIFGEAQKGDSNLIL